jgi:hypothetical protein
MTVLRRLAAIVSGLFLATPAFAQVWSTATAYASSLNSPYFSSQTVGRHYYLEDFEDGLINTPGLSLIEATVFLNAPGSGTDSVDIDDYTLNGSGVGGRSLAPMSPTGSLTFQFDNTILGNYPTKVGFVWTDGLPNNQILITAWNPQGITVQQVYSGLGDANGGGGTAEDRFIGVDWVAGIKFLRVQSLVGGLEIDHVQYSAPVTSNLYVRDQINSDATGDLIWHRAETGQVEVWTMNGLTKSAAPTSINAATTWEPKGCGDLDGDGDTDIIWRDSATGFFHVWLMAGSTVSTNSQVLNATAVASTFAVIAVGDFDGDKKADIVFRSTVNGDVTMWKMNGNVRVDGQLVGNPNGAEYLGCGDFNGDGRYDFLWRQANTNIVFGWLMNGFTLIEAAAVGGVNAIGTQWKVGSVGDLNADGRADVIWRNSSTGIVNSWIMNNLYKTSGGVSAPISLDWTLRASADISGDGRVDVIWTNTVADKVNGWLMNGIVKVSGGTIAPTPGPGWSLINR